MVAFDGGVWVANSVGQSVSGINARTRRVVDTIEVGNGPHSITQVSNRVWVSNEDDGTVSMIDPTTERRREEAPHRRLRARNRE